MSDSQISGSVIHLAWVRWWSALAYYTFSMASGLDRVGCRSRIVAPVGSPLANRAGQAGLADADSDRWRDLASADPTRVVKAVRVLRRAARTGEVAAVIAHTGRGHAPAAFALAGGRAPILRVRADIRRPSRGPLSRWLYAKATDRILLSGDFMRNGYLDGLGISRSRIVTLPAGIDPAEADRIDAHAARSRLRSTRGWPGTAPVVGMLARYSPVKGHRNLVDAARLLLSRHRDLHFFLAGPEGQIGRAGVEAWVREAGLSDRFAVLDPVDDPLLAAAGFDIALILSEGSEAVCRSALEYMALGLPIVATRVNAIPETLGDAGILIPAGDPVALAEAVTRLLDQPEHARGLGRAAASRVRAEFDLAKIASAAAAILRDAREERRGNA